jgi:hypothetical protein
MQATNAAGQQSSWSSPLFFTVDVTTLPVINSISPPSPTLNSSPQPITINGSGFQSGLQVSFTPTVGGSVFVTPSSVTTSTIQVSPTLNQTGAWAVEVKNPDGGQAVPYGFTVAAAALSAPTLLTPANGGTGVAPNMTSFSWTAVTGVNSGYNILVATSSSGLPQGAAAASACTSCVFNSSTASGVTSWSPPTPLNSGTVYFWEVQGKNSSGAGNWSGIFSFTTLTLPVINSISPPTPTLNSSPQAITINGSGFQSGLQVSFTPTVGGSVFVTPSSVTTSTIQVSPTLNQTGAWAVEVKNPDGGQAVPFGFTVAAAAPSISSLNSTHYASSNSNQTMLINGNNFQSGDTLTFVPPEGGTISSTASKLTFVSTTN